MTYPIRFASTCCLLVLATGLMDPAEGQDQNSLEAADATRDAPIRKREPTQFVRFLRDEFGDPIALQTATAKYVLENEETGTELEVVLEGVIHIADRSYYKALSRRLQHYDAVLYEFVAPAERRIPDPATAPRHPFALLQQLAAQGLGLTDQLAEMDYQAENFVHADLSPEELRRLLEERGDDSFTVFADSLLHWIRRANKSAADEEESANRTEFNLAELVEPGGTLKVRRLLAEQFANPGDLEAALPPLQRTLLIEDRNDRAMEVFEEQLAAGHRRIAFFWGAGHMQDFERRLMLEYDLKPAGVIWRNAWDLREGAVERPPLEALLGKTLRGVLKEAAELAPRENPE